MEQINAEEGRNLEKRILIKDELMKLRSLEHFEIDNEDLVLCREYLNGKKNKDELTSDEAVDYYNELIPFIVRELEKKKIALDNMRAEKKDVSSIFGQGKIAPGRAVPPDIKEWLKKLEGFGVGGSEYDKLKKLLFQRDVAGRLVKSEPELYALIAEFSINEIDKFKGELDKFDVEKKKSKLSKLVSLGTEEMSSTDALPSEIEEAIKRLETCDVEVSKLEELKKKIYRKKPTGEISLSMKEIYGKIFEFCEQELKRAKARWIRDKKLEATIDGVRAAQADRGFSPPPSSLSPASGVSEQQLRAFPDDVTERLTRLEGFDVNTESLEGLKTDLQKKNSNGNFVNSYSDLCNKVIDFYEKVLKERSKDLELMEQFKEKNILQSSDDVIGKIDNNIKTNELENIKNELLRREKLASEYFARSQRLEIDLKRLKDRNDKSIDELKNRSNEKLILRLLVVIDDLDRALSASAICDPNNYKSLLEGIGLISRRLVSILQREGLQPIEAVGKEFDPKVHEAFEKVENSEYPEDTVIEVMRQGYLLGSKLLRPSLVKVSKKN